jgi:hypothetical protein
MSSSEIEEDRKGALQRESRESLGVFWTAVHLVLLMLNDVQSPIYYHSERFFRPQLRMPTMPHFFTASVSFASSSVVHSLPLLPIGKIQFADPSLTILCIRSTGNQRSNCDPVVAMFLYRFRQFCVFRWCPFPISPLERFSL